MRQFLRSLINKQVEIRQLLRPYINKLVDIGRGERKEAAKARDLDVIINPKRSSKPQFIVRKRMEFTLQELYSVVYREPIIVLPAKPVIRGGEK